MERLPRRRHLSHLGRIAGRVSRELRCTEKERSGGSVVAKRRCLLGGLVEELRGRLVAVDRRVGDVMAALDRIEAHSRQPRVDPSPLIRQRQLERRRRQQRVWERQPFPIELENAGLDRRLELRTFDACREQHFSRRPQRRRRNCGRPAGARIQFPQTLGKRKRERRQPARVLHSSLPHQLEGEHGAAAGRLAERRQSRT